MSSCHAVHRGKCHSAPALKRLLGVLLPVTMGTLMAPLLRKAAHRTPQLLLHHLGLLHCWLPRMLRSTGCG